MQPEQRQCLGITKDGRRCRAWALSEGIGGILLCVRHAKGGRGKQLSTWRRAAYRPPSKSWVCRCAAYAWPHRPGSGDCAAPRDSVTHCGPGVRPWKAFV